MPTPRLSLIIPCLNPPSGFFSMLKDLVQRGGENLEVIISNGGELDNSRLPVSDLIQCWSEPDSGQAEALNKGIRRANGDIIGYLNADDLLFSGALALVEQSFSRFPDVMILYGQAIHIDESGLWLNDYPTQSWDYEALKADCFLCQPAVFWRRDIHDKFGYFDENLHFALDYDFWLRVGKHIPFHFLHNQYLAKSRLHPESKTVKYPLQAKWENLQVKQRHNPFVDIRSAFDYCALVAKEQTEENDDPERFAELFLEGMKKVESSFELQDRKTWETAKKEMTEMATISKAPKLIPKRIPRILVDLSLFQSGGIHGGIKPALYRLLQEIHKTGECELVLVISPGLRDEIREIFGSSMTVSIWGEHTNADTLKTEYHPDLLFCPLPSIRLHHPEVPLIFMSPDLLHLDYPDSLEPADREYRHQLFLEAREKAALFLTVSKFSRDRLIQAYTIPHRKVWILPHALLENKTSESSQSGDPYFLYPANFWTHKNHRTLLVAFKSYLHNAEIPWKLVLTGHPKSGNTDEIAQLILSLGLENHVDYRGYLSGEDYDDVWARASALVFPSNYEGFGLHLLEAMNRDIPILAADLPSLREVADDAAIYFDQHSPQAISQALLKISRDPTLRESLVKKGRERSRVFNWEAPTRTFINLAVNLVEKSQTMP